MSCARRRPRNCRTIEPLQDIDAPRHALHPARTIEAHVANRAAPGENQKAEGKFQNVFPAGSLNLLRAALRTSLNTIRVHFAVHPR